MTTNEEKPVVWKKIVRRIVGAALGGVAAIPAAQLVTFLPTDMQTGATMGAVLAVYAAVAQGLKKFSGELSA
jgi:uncharacterized membrane protein YccC